MTAEALVHRSHHELPEHMREALAWYQTRWHSLPPGVTVHTSQIGAAQAALPAETELTVEGLGGCLTNEIWLWLPDPEEKTA